MPSNTTKMQEMPSVKVEATGKCMTVNAGLIVVLKFMKKLSFSRIIPETVSTPERAANSKYSFSDIVQMVVCTLIAGGTAIDHVSKICGDKVISRCAGWKSVPHPTNIGRIVKEVRQENIHELESLNHKLREKVWNRAVRAGHKLPSATTRNVIDLDSSVQGVCGKQEGAQKGYNPKKKGQLSYHPQIAFCADTKEVLHSWYRCGSAYTSNGAVEFMKELMAAVRPGIKYFLRTDSGYFDGKLLDYLELIGAGYLIKVAMRNLKKLLVVQSWIKSQKNPNCEETVFNYKCGTWTKARTFVAVRFQTGVTDDMFKTPIYDYFSYVTTLSTEKMSPLEIHKYYGKRATAETWIEECKSQMGAGHMRTSEFLANSVLFQCGIIAYNILKWIALFAGPVISKWEVKTIRLWLIRVAGKLTFSGGQLTLKLPDEFIYSEYWDVWEQITHGLSFN